MFNIDNINRRQFIKKSAIGILIAGGAFAAGKIIVSPPDMGLPNPFPELPDQKPVIPPYNKNALFFNEHQYALVATLAAIIIPTDDEPGATEAGVVDYIDTLLAGSEKKQAVYDNGLKWIDKFSQKKYGSGKDFLNLSIGAQIGLLRLIDETYNMRHRSVSSLLQRVDRKIDKIWDDLFGAGENSRFFKIIHKDVLEGFFSNPVSWKAVGFFGPPQPVGYLNFPDPPSSTNYKGSIRLVDNKSCLICHKDGKHPRGGLIDHTCISCHRPHSPWPYDKDAFHIEDHIEFLFPSPDRKRS
jgi:gluconate 2-dehydrogenase gamma chain